MVLIHTVMKASIVQKATPLHLHMDVSENGGTQQPWVFLLKMIILGCFGGTTIYGNTHIFPDFDWDFQDLHGFR